jgi:hypothetical protein
MIYDIFKKQGFNDIQQEEYINYDPEDIMNAKSVMPEKTDFYKKYQTINGIC